MYPDSYPSPHLSFYNKMKKKYHTIGPISNWNIQIVKIDTPSSTVTILIGKNIYNIDTPNTHKNMADHTTDHNNTNNSFKNPQIYKYRNNITETSLQWYREIQMYYTNDLLLWKPQTYKHRNVSDQ